VQSEAIGFSHCPISDNALFAPGLACWIGDHTKLPCAWPTKATSPWKERCAWQGQLRACSAANDEDHETAKATRAFCSMVYSQLDAVISVCRSPISGNYSMRGRNDVEKPHFIQNSHKSRLLQAVNLKLSFRRSLELAPKRCQRPRARSRLLNAEKAHVFEEAVSCRRDRALMSTSMLSWRMPPAAKAWIMRFGMRAHRNSRRVGPLDAGTPLTSADTKQLAYSVFVGAPKHRFEEDFSSAGAVSSRAPERMSPPSRYRRCGKALFCRATIKNGT